MLLNCGVNDSWESLGLQGDPTSPSWRRSVLGVHWKDWCWGWNSSTLGTSCEELTHWKRPWCGEGLGAGGEGDHRGWDGWMASLARWTWVWWTLGVGDGQGSLACCGSWGQRSRTWLSDWTETRKILKSRHITLPTNICLVKAVVFPVVMYGCESWTIKAAEHRRIDAFELWCWRRLLGAPWTAWRSNQSILKEKSPEYSLEGLMLKLNLQYFGHLMWRTDLVENSLILGKIEGRKRRRQHRMRWHHRLDGHEFEQRRREQQRIRWLDGITYSMEMSLSTFREIVKGREAWHAGVHGVSESQTWFSDWTIVYIIYICIYI